MQVDHTASQTPKQILELGEATELGLVPPTWRCWWSPTAHGAEASGTQEGWGNRCCPLVAGAAPAHSCLRPFVETLHLAFGFGAPSSPALEPDCSLPNSLHKLFRF